MMQSAHELLRSRFDSRRSKVQERDELEPDPPKRFFKAFKKKEPIDGAPSKAATPNNIFHRSSASKDSNSQVGMWCCVTCALYSLYQGVAELE